jgi:hypothetical protein
MDLQEAKNHKIKLKKMGVHLELKTNGATCSSGCKITVELWGDEKDQDMLVKYFNQDFLKNVQGHKPNFEHISSVFDASATEVICQACGARFSPTLNVCPDCGLVY